MRKVVKNILKIILVAVLSILLLAFFIVSIEIPFFGTIADKILEKLDKRKKKKAEDMEESIKRE